MTRPTAGTAGTRIESPDRLRSAPAPPAATPPRRPAAARLRLGLLALGLAGGLIALAGCGGSSSSSTTQTTQTTATSPFTSTATPTTTQPAVTPPAPSGPATVRASSGALSASLHAGTHRPKVDAAWPIRFTVTDNGQLAAAKVSYEYLFGGQVVAHRSTYRFKGRFADVFRWPSSAVGYPLTFRAVISSGGVTVNLDYPVQVRK